MINEAKRFINAVFGKYFSEGNTGYIEVRYITKNGKTYSDFFSIEDFNDDNVTRKIEENNKDYHIYVGVNPRPPSKNKKQDDIKDILTLWADVDAKDFEGGKEEALRRIKEFPISPSILVDSGNGYHLYWLLENSIINIEEKERLEIRKILSGIIKEIGADHAHNLDRVMRLPGTLNIKDSPKECQIVYSNGKTYILEDFESYKDKAFKHIASVEEENELLSILGDKNLEISMENAQDAKDCINNNLKIPSKYKRLIIQGGTQKGKDVFYKSRSERDWAIIMSLILNRYNYVTCPPSMYHLHTEIFNLISFWSRWFIPQRTMRSIPVIFPAPALCEHSCFQ